MNTPLVAARGGIAQLANHVYCMQLSANDSSAQFAEYEIFSSRPSSDFGRALKLADMNGDGVDDLLIGAPSYYDEAAGSSRVQGCVFVVMV